MKENGKKEMLTGMISLSAFVVWTALIQTIDVKNVGLKGSSIGFATLNVWFHEITGVHMLLYTISDWLGLVPIVICMILGMLGLVQLIKRRSLLKVDADIICLGVYYILVIMGYLLFETVPINYRPVLIEGRLEPSYPSSTTLLVLSVMPTLNFQADRRIGSVMIKKSMAVFSIVFSLFMVGCRIIAGVHWLTDIIGSVLLSYGLYTIYRYAVVRFDKTEVTMDQEMQNGVW